MGRKYLVVERARPGCGRNGDETWVNVVVGTVIVGGNGEVSIDPFYTRENGTHFLVEVEPPVFYPLQSRRNLFADDDAESPRRPLVQQRVAGDRPTPELGHFADGRDPNSEWRSGQPRSRE